jgi:hypothetical protein
LLEYTTALSDGTKSFSPMAEMIPSGQYKGHIRIFTKQNQTAFEINFDFVYQR